MTVPMRSFIWYNSNTTPHGHSLSEARWMAPSVSPIAEIGGSFHEHTAVIIINLGGECAQQRMVRDDG